MRRAGIHCRFPDDAASGGTDFSDAQQITLLKNELTDLASRGHRLYLHLAPPCSTFTRARDRSRETRVRSFDYPEGIPPLPDEIVYGNAVAKRALDLAAWANRELGAVSSVENPDTS